MMVAASLNYPSDVSFLFFCKSNIYPLISVFHFLLFLKSKSHHPPPGNLYDGISAFKWVL